MNRSVSRSVDDGSSADEAAIGFTPKCGSARDSSENLSLSSSRLGTRSGTEMTPQAALSTPSAKFGLVTWRARSKVISVDHTPTTSTVPHLSKDLEKVLGSVDWPEHGNINVQSGQLAPLFDQLVLLLLTAGLGQAHAQLSRHGVQALGNAALPLLLRSEWAGLKSYDFIGKVELFM